MGISFRNVVAAAGDVIVANIFRTTRARIILSCAALLSPFVDVPNLQRRRQSTLVRFYARIDSEAKIDIPSDGFRDRVLNIRRRYTAEGKNL